MLTGRAQAERFHARHRPDVRLVNAIARRLVTASVLCQAGTGPGWLLLPGGAMELSGGSTGEVAGARRALPRGAPQLKTALACIIGARRACTVEMMSSDEIPCR